MKATDAVPKPFNAILKMVYRGYCPKIQKKYFVHTTFEPLKTELYNCVRMKQLKKS